MAVPAGLIFLFSPLFHSMLVVCTEVSIIVLFMVLGYLLLVSLGFKLGSFSDKFGHLISYFMKLCLTTNIIRHILLILRTFTVAALQHWLYKLLQ